VFVRGWTAARPWVLEVEVETVEVPLSKVLNTGSCEEVHIRPCLHHGSHFLSAEVPTTDRQHCLQILVLLLESVNPSVPGARQEWLRVGK